MKTSEIRNEFLSFFEEKGHRRLASSPLVPANDPSLLFTNAGMVQFKDVFLGLEDPGFTRATTSQRCVRAGGKHNDLDNVGYTARHHTFFEMLGNFSFGDYFKREAIEYAWELLTERYRLSPDKLWVTVFDDDDEAAEIWLRHIGVNPKHFARCGEKDNFWMMGDTGPCGPCSEIFYDHGPDIAGGPPGTSNADGERYVEIWNLVFMQYERDAAGQLAPIPKPSVDTGMGLERLAAVLQGVHNDYDIDLFRGLIDAVREHAPADDLDIISLRVVADHIRSSAFLVMDGVTPSNEGRGYVLRRIIRRALRHGHKLGFTEPFFYRFVAVLDQQMGEAIPDLGRASARIKATLKQEEERFSETLEQGLKIFESAVANLDGRTIPGDVAFKLNDTYGFPVDLTADIARERGLAIDMAGYEAAMDAQRTRARGASQFVSAAGARAIGSQALAKIGRKQAFSGYETTVQAAKIVGLFRNSKAVEVVNTGDTGVIVLDTTPFYAESGGQVGDRGTIVVGDTVFAVLDSQKQADLTLHYGTVERGRLKVADHVEAIVGNTRRQAIRLNHSATHLLHAALRRVLGDDVAQKGSLVDDECLRFDFSHPQALAPDELMFVERVVNEQIRENHDIEVQSMSYQAAINSGAVALFGEKYADEVRVLRMGTFSVELCGGTHARRTGDIGLFMVIAESGVAAGVRRIEGVTGTVALERMQDRERTLKEIAALLKSTTEGVAQKVEQLHDRARTQDKEIQNLKRHLAGQSSGDLAATAVRVGDIRVVSAAIEDADIAGLRSATDRLKDQLQRAVVVLATIEGDKVRLIAGITKDLTERMAAGDLVNFVARQVGGKGGGRPDMAQAGGNEPAKLDIALASVKAWVEDRQSS
ncbi:MAG: alanine--tRNA ligase [Proteobacteria bacterium]|nr:MAG: alanine--tRNA ligase [Pseudomonadota bacterium]